MYNNHNDNNNGDYSRSQGNNNNPNNVNITRQPTQQQREQLHLQRQHQERLQQQMQAEDSLRLNLESDTLHRNQQQQYRVARQDNNNNDAAAGGEPKPPGYFSYPPQPQHADSSLTTSSDGHDDGTFKSRFRRLFRFPCSAYGKGLIAVIGVEALLVIIMQVVIVLLYFGSLVDDPLPPPTEGPNKGVSLPPYLDTNNESRSIPAYLIVFVFAQLFQLVLAWDAVRAQNTIELIGVVMFNLCCFVYSIFEISQIQASLEKAGRYGFFDSKDGKSSQQVSMDLNTSLRPFLIVVVCFIGITQCLITWLAYRLFQEFGWKIYKKIGADPNIKKMYRAYQIYLVLIKVDLFFFVGFSIQFIYLTLTRRSNDPEYWLTIIILPVTIPILYSAIYAVRHESRRWMAVFLTAMLGGVVYFIYKIVRMYVGEKVPIYTGVNRFLTLFASLCLVTILLTIANAAVCYFNFGRGLKAHLVHDGRPSPNTGTSSAGGRVMEID
ncbi:hypothetical protein BGX23_003191 [Mortierella sp. AD031]|nr:hypothetical protein BGX23_003191 [Mortierella sp. AD031]